MKKAELATDHLDRRSFFKQASCGAVSLGVVAGSPREARGDAEPRRLPYKIGIRHASLRDPENPAENMVGNFDTFRVAQGIPGITGVELQVTQGNPNMRDLSVARRYKAEAHLWGLNIPTTAGVWDHPIWGTHSALDLINSLRASEIVGARVMLVAFFRDAAPDMSDEASYGPVVSLLKDMAPRAEDAGIILGLENSLSPQDNKTLVEMVDHPAVKVYYDLDNMYFYGHGAEAAVAGVKILGNELIAAVHAKNQEHLLEHPGRVDWAAAFEALTEIGYDGWIIFESQHSSAEQAREATIENIAFVKRHFTPPVV